MIEFLQWITTPLRWFFKNPRGSVWGKVLLIALLFVVAGGYDAPTVVNPWLKILGIPAITATPYRLGLDLKGGVRLVYDADVRQVPSKEVGAALEGVRDVIERRINQFGVAEPLVQVAESENNWRVIVELAGLTDIEAAIKQIGETPLLEFKEENPSPQPSQLATEGLKKPTTETGKATADGEYPAPPPDLWKYTGLTGKQLKRAAVEFNPQTSTPQVTLQFNDEGTKLFAEVTKRNVGRAVAIFLDGNPISIPRVNEAIEGGSAVITGDFTVKEAKLLAQRLNAGALPVPISLTSQQVVGASLGSESVERSLKAGLIGLLAVVVFMILYYRLPGLMASLALLVYTAITLAIFKAWPVTLTLAGIAGTILSVGMAVDANVLIFERLKEELRAGKSVEHALKEGFHRAWTSIRDSNISSLITCAVLLTFTSSSVKGFALTLAIGILVSLFTAITVTRSFLQLILPLVAAHRWLFGVKRR